MLSKSKLIERIKNSTEVPVSKDHVEAIVEETFNKIIEALCRGEEVYLPKFGKFYVRYVKGRTIKNTGIPWLQNQSFDVKDSMKLGFKASTSLNKQIQEEIYKFVEQTNKLPDKFDAVIENEL